jgi:TolA-binding protein
MTKHKRIRGLVFGAALLLAGATLSGCPGRGATEMLDTAQLEEKQENFPNARKLYEQIVRDYPGSPEAAKAAERLAALQAAGR